MNADDFLEDGKPNFECEWRGCTRRGNPWEDHGWCWWPRKYLWLNEGFFCPEHDKVIEEGIKIGAFNDWPLDTSPEVLEYQEAMAEFHDIDTPEGQAILDEADHG